MPGGIDQLDLGRQLGELTAAVKANTQANRELTERIETLEAQMADVHVTRKSLTWVGKALLLIAGAFGGKAVDWFWGHWRP
jgi:hypothetical protein